MTDQPTKGRHPVLDTIKGFYQKEPALINAAVTGVVILVASLFGVVLDKATVWQYVAGGAALLLGAGVATRAKVTPVKQFAPHPTKHR
jgi:hypothetical protein